MRTCTCCGGELKKIKELKAGFRRRKILRLQCVGCSLETSTNLSEAEEREMEEKSRELERLTRLTNNYETLTIFEYEN